MYEGLPRWHSGKESDCQGMRCRRCVFDSGINKILWSRKLQPTSVFLLGKFSGQMSLVGCSPWDHKELDMTEWLSTHARTHIWMTLFLRSQFCFIDLYFMFSVQMMLFWSLLWLWNLVWNQEVWYLHHFLRIALAVHGLLWLHTHLRIFCFVSVKNVLGLFIGFAIESLDCFR